jgi:hypothetical protein
MLSVCEQRVQWQRDDARTSLAARQRNTKKPKATAAAYNACARARSRVQHAVSNIYGSV